MYIVKVLLVILDILLDHNNKKKNICCQEPELEPEPELAPGKKFPKPQKRPAPKPHPADTGSAR